MLNPLLTFQPEELSALCSRYRVRTLYIFGSATRMDFKDDSDVDIMVEFDSGHEPGLFHLVQMKDELEVLFARPVDLSTPEILANPFRRASIVKDLERLYGS